MEDNAATRRCRPRAVMAVIGGILVHLALGSYYTFGNMAPYMISYLRFKTDQPGTQNVDSLWISTLAVIPGPLIPFVSWFLETRFGCRTATAAGCLLMSLGNALTYFTIKTSLSLVVLTYGFCSFGGLIMAYLIPIQNATRWFPGSQGLVSGIIVCGFGGSTLIMNQIITSYINPKNLSPDFKTPDGERYFTDDDLLDRVPKMFLILACIYAGLTTLGIAMLCEPKVFSERQEIIEVQQTADDEEQPLLTGSYGSNDMTYKETLQKEFFDEINLSSSRSSFSGFVFAFVVRLCICQSIIFRSERLPFKEAILLMLKNRNSYIVALVAFFIFAGMQFNITLYKAYGQTFISDDNFLALVGSFAAILNCAGRPFWGYLLDKYGFKITIMLLSASFVCILSTMSLTEKLGKVAFMIWICGSYGSFCGIAPMGPSTMAKLFGKDNMVINMCMVYLALFSAEVFGGLIGLTLKNTIGWHGLFLMAGCFGAIGILAFFMKFDPSREKGPSGNSAHIFEKKIGPSRGQPETAFQK